jgi:hypothetical protein
VAEVAQKAGQTESEDIAVEPMFPVGGFLSIGYTTGGLIRYQKAPPFNLGRSSWLMPLPVATMVGVINLARWFQWTPSPFK